MNQRLSSAASLGLRICSVCALLSRPLGAVSRCPRCGTILHARIPQSVSRTWTLLILAVILYIPANTLPMMHTSSLFGSQSDTILSGVAYFWKSGSWYLAIIIFCASIMVPLLKMIALAVLLISVQRRSRWQQDQRTKLYRLVQFVGRWSMLDVYVVAVVVSLVQAGVFATAEPGPGVVAFGSVVILTMFAAKSFDPRLIWDASEPTDG